MTANYTPNGRADAVYQLPDGTAVFAKPEERQIRLPQLVRELREPTTLCGVPYLSFQNDNLRSQAPQLIADTPLWPWAAAVLGEPEAVNIWVGDARSVSSTHKDHYENLYAVTRGRKSFWLLPPCDLPWLYQRDYPVATWAHDHASCECAARDSGGGPRAQRGPRDCGTAGAAAGAGADDGIHPCWRLVPDADGATVPWISVDPSRTRSQHTLERFPLARHARPLHVTLSRGDVLYLPSMWFHQVEHEPGEPAVAVNFWFDMNFLSPNYALFRMVEELSSQLHAALDAAGDADADSNQAHTAGMRECERAAGAVSQAPQQAQANNAARPAQACADPTVISEMMVVPSAGATPVIFPMQLTPADVIEPCVYTRIITLFRANIRDDARGMRDSGSHPPPAPSSGAHVDAQLPAWMMAAADTLTTAFQATVDAFPVVAGLLSVHADGTYSVGQGAGALLVFQRQVGSALTISGLEAAGFPARLLPSALAASTWTAKPTDPLLQAHVTFFDDGVAVSVSLHHVVADGAAAFNLLQFWSDIARVGRRDVAWQPVLDRQPLVAAARTAAVAFEHPEYKVTTPAPPSAAPIPRPFEVANASPAMQQQLPQQHRSAGLAAGAASRAGAGARDGAGAAGEPQLCNGCFSFTPAALRRLKQAAVASVACDGRGATTSSDLARLSTNDAVTALMWRAATRARAADAAPMASHTSCLFAVDCRSRLEPPLAPGYFGNVNIVAFPRAERAALVSEPLGDAAMRVRRATAARTDAYVRSVLALVEAVPNKRSLAFSANTYCGPDFVVSNWSKFGSFVDFGFGPPVAFRTLPPACFDGVSILLPRPDGGIDAFTGLQATHWARLLADAELAQFAELPHE